ncbi:Conserved_hypothetical protein [Hexamita inflata]|uniref:Uncharacterized protein n=1 Tax=Hexamita inflata TaxID=28002 RepID=A0AA86P1D8_9EUKA|nr:Conserved hypothetical protein [Hexamita inflata]
MFKKPGATPTTNTQNTPKPQISNLSGQQTTAAQPQGGSSVQANIMQRQQAQIKDLEQQLQDLQKNYNQLNQESQAAQNSQSREREELMAQNQRLMNQNDALNAELRKINEDQSREQETKMNQTQSVVKEQENRYTQLKQEYDKLAQQLTEETRAKFAAMDEAQQAKNFAETLRQQVEDLMDQKETLENQLLELEGKNQNDMKNSQTVKTVKVKINMDEDEPEVFSATQMNKSEVQNQTGLNLLKKNGDVDKEQVIFGFKEAERTILELQELNQQYKNDIALLKRAHEQTLSEKKTEMDNLAKEVEEKTQEIEALQIELDNQKFMEVNDKVYDQIITKTKDSGIKMAQNKEQGNSLQVYHSLVNPSAQHNARQEYTLIKNELTILKSENEILKRRIKELEDVSHSNQVLQGKVSNLATLASNVGSKNAMNKMKDINQTFNNMDLQQQLADIKLKMKLKPQDSFVNTMRGRSLLQRSAIEVSLLIDPQEALSPQPPTQLQNQSNDDVNIPTKASQEEINAYINDMPEQQLRQEHAELIQKIDELESKLAETEMAAEQVKVYQQAIENLQTDNETLKKAVTEQEIQNQNQLQQAQKIETKYNVQKQGTEEKSIQCGITYDVVKISKESQTSQVKDFFSRAQPSLIQNDGLEFQMQTDSFFTVLNPKQNSITKKYKMTNNIILDEAGNKVDFNGTYKDNRGVFSVVHGIVDKQPQEYVMEIMDDRNNSAQLLQQLNMYKKEIMRYEGENDVLTQQLNKTRKQLALLKGKTMQEIILDDDIEENTTILTKNDQLIQTDMTLMNFQAQNQTQVQTGSDQIAQFIGQCLSAMTTNNKPNYNTNYSGYRPVNECAQSQPQMTISQPKYSGNMIARCTSPTIPEYHYECIQHEIVKEVQTDIYVVPVDQLLLEKEKLNQYSKENSRLIMQIQKQQRIEEELKQKKKEQQLAIKHMEELNKEIDQANKIISEHKQQIIQLQNQLSIALQNKNQFSDVFMLTNQSHQDMFDNLRQRIAQKEAQISDLQRLLQMNRDDSLNQINNLTAQIEQFRQISDEYTRLKMTSYKNDVEIHHQALTNEILSKKFTDKMDNFDALNKGVEAELRNCLKENTKLKKAGECIKQAYQIELNKNITLTQVNQTLKNSLVLLFSFEKWIDLELVIQKDDLCIGIEQLVKERTKENIKLHLINESNHQQSLNMESNIGGTKFEPLSRDKTSPVKEIKEVASLSKPEAKTFEVKPEKIEIAPQNNIMDQIQEELEAQPAQTNDSTEEPRKRKVKKLIK